MPQAKLELKVGAIAFSGEGEQKWLGEQLSKLLEKAGELSAAAPPEDDASGGGGDTVRKAKQAGTLAAFLATAGATSNQVKRFLATAEWLHRKGSSRLMTKDVSKALQDNHQKRLGNPADCLNKNVSKGYCEKAGKEFFVTDDGRATLGNA